MGLLRWIISKFRREPSPMEIHHRLSPFDMEDQQRRWQKQREIDVEARGRKC